MSAHHFSTIGFIGAGNMATALARGMASRNPELKFLVSDPSEESLKRFCEQIPGATNVAANSAVVESSDMTFLAVKPQQLPSVFPDGPPADRTVLVSVLAGVRIARLEQATGQSKVIRVMPNTPCLIGKGAIGFCANRNIAPEEEACAIELLEATGIVRRVEEPLLDVVTAVSGSGPAYIFFMIEAMVAAGIRLGLEPETAHDLVVQTVVGAGLMAQSTDQSPAELRRAVTSPGGTTAAALSVMQTEKFTELIEKAIGAAADRARELSE